MRKLTTIIPVVVSSGLISAALADSAENEAKAESPKEAKPALKAIEFGNAEKMSFPGQKVAEGGTFVDFDGDGKLDFVSGNYAGNIIVRKNSAQKGIKLGEPTMLKRGENLIKLKHWWCGTIAPQFADMNGDGKGDFVVGCFQGYLHFVGQEADGTFAQEKYMKDEKGEYFHFGQFWDIPGKKWATVPLVDGVDSGIGLYPKLVDFDGDGDIDILVGTRKGMVAYKENIGTVLAPKFSAKLELAKADSKLINFGFNASVDSVDLDGDKVNELIVVSPDKGVVVYRQDPAKKGMNFTTVGAIADSAKVKLSYPCVSTADVNGDGKLDVVVNSGRDWKTDLKFSNFVFYGK